MTILTEERPQINNSICYLQKLGKGKQTPNTSKQEGGNYREKAQINTIENLKSKSKSWFFEMVNTLIKLQLDSRRKTVIDKRRIQSSDITTNLKEIKNVIRKKHGNCMPTSS